MCGMPRLRPWPAKTGHDAAFVCVQEALRGQVRDIAEALSADGDAYTSIGRGRDDGQQAGEFRPSSTARPSRGWDAVLNRVVTVGQARHESAGLILQIAAKWAVAMPQVPIFLGGDFNSEPDDGAYKTITAGHDGMLDMAGLVPPHKRYGNGEFTYTSFDEPSEVPKRIDFLFDDGVFLSDHRAVVADILVSIPQT
ncbi:endonuclease exonuclease phosphatase family protein [Ophiostoma piceae UAMH 11346]|uniref:Endonuclease exonuclease phosphatase family protein n=1 Tax=Ophiostoma piceae (strain UAMH 11346) TaxID=1262450 RepID=S3CSV9_OPHP1|nr:endonuclease exonuclease phosphatase family protein [Ophiostoma piceae UAMH 11346]